MPSSINFVDLTSTLDTTSTTLAGAPRVMFVADSISSMPGGVDAKPVPVISTPAADLLIETRGSTYHLGELYDILVAAAARLGVVTTHFEVFTHERPYLETVALYVQQHVKAQEHEVGQLWDVLGDAVDVWIAELPSGQRAFFESGIAYSPVW